eukprot:scaffold3651_cov156-Amphora_coffeaeformis.AAC.6
MTCVAWLTTRHRNARETEFGEKDRETEKSQDEVLDVVANNKNSSEFGHLVERQPLSYLPINFSRLQHTH